jgi:hypothetical protein
LIWCWVCERAALVHTGAVDGTIRGLLTAIDALRGNVAGV